MSHVPVTADSTAKNAELLSLVAGYYPGFW